MTWSPVPEMDLDFSRARPALVWNYLLGEKDNHWADREAAEKMISALPDVRMMARANRWFMFHAVCHVLREFGIRQFIDIGAGMPTTCYPNVHEVAQDGDPTARVTYVDNDPLVAAHIRALHTSHPAGRVEFLAADAADPGTVLNDPVVTGTLDLSRPVALLMVSVLMHFPDAAAHHIASTLVAGLPAGSCVVITHPTADFDPNAMSRFAAAAQESGITYIPRTHAQVHRFFTSLDMTAPGVVPLLAWTPHPADAPDSPFSREVRSIHYWAGVGRRRPLA